MQTEHLCTAPLTVQAQRCLEQTYYRMVTEKLNLEKLQREILVTFMYATCISIKTSQIIIVRLGS